MRAPRISSIAFAGGLMVAVSLAAGEGPQPATGDIETLAWLAGCWEGESGEECWLAPLGGTMLGVNRGPERAAGDQPTFEFLRIVERDGGLAYLASPSGRFPPVAFQAVEISESKVVFANPEHDFPQRISYRLEGEGALRARVEALENGDWQGFDVVWSRGAAAGWTSP